MIRPRSDTYSKYKMSSQLIDKLLCLTLTDYQGYRDTCAGGPLLGRRATNSIPDTSSTGRFNAGFTLLLIETM